MSDYLVREIEALPAVDVRGRVQVVDGHGGSFLEEFVLRGPRHRDSARRDTGVLFVLIGSRRARSGSPARSSWTLGSVLTGADAAASGAWPRERQPLLLETTLPGVFAVGDVRAGSVKRVASAVGEGALAVTLVHQYLASLRRPASPGG